MLLFIATPCLVVAVQSCMEWILILKKHSEKNGFVLKPSRQQIWCFIQNSLRFFVIKCEPVGVTRSRRLFWNKQKWLSKVLCFNFLRNYISSRNGTYSIHIKIYLWSFAIKGNFILKCPRYRHYIYDLVDWDYFLFFSVIKIFDTASCILW